MKKTLQQAHETQEVTKQNSAITSNYRIDRIGYTSFQSEGSSKTSTSSLRNKSETAEKDVVKSNGLKNGGTFHYDRSDSLKSGISDNGDGVCSVDISVSEQREVSDSAVINVSLCDGSPNDSSDGKLGAENVESGGHRPKSCLVLHRSAPADQEKAKDRLVKSHSHIEQLQQNLATKLSTETVAAFIHEYSPALGRRSHSSVERSPLIDGDPNGRGGCGSHNVADPFPTSRNQDNIRNNRKIRYSKSAVGKGGSLGSVLIKKKFVFLNAFFDRPVIKHHRKHTYSHKNDGRTPGETEGSRQLDVNSPVQSVENGSTQLEGKKGNRNRDCGRPSADAVSPNCGKTDVNSNIAVPSDKFEKDTEAAGKSRNPFPSNSPGHGDNRSSASQQHTYNTLERVVVPSPPKPARVSWTEALIQKLTEEEAKKKTKSQTKVQKPRRIVRFPQKKPSKVVNEDKPTPSEGVKKQRVSAPLSQPTTEIPTKQSDSERNFLKKDTKGNNPSGVILDDKSKDAYANLVSQLLVSTNQEESQQVSELKGEDFVLKQRELEEIRAAIAREECASIISDDDSVILAPTTASTESIETGRRKEPKPSGIRRLLPQVVFSHKHRQVDKADEVAAQEPLLNRVDPSRVYPATTTARPVLETAFLSDLNSKLPVRSGVRQQQLSQSSSPAPRHKQPSPRTRRHQDRDQTSIQENEQNSSRISHQTRSKSLSPSRDRSSSAASRTSKRTIPDTSLVLEERLQHIRRELSSPPGRNLTRPSSATPPDYPNRVPQRHDSLPLPSNKTTQQEQIYQNTGRVYSSAPSNAYYHSPPSRRRQQNKDPENDNKADDYRRKASGGSSASSSSSTIVAESPPVSALSWNPLLLNLENHAISGSPDIRKLQHHRHPQHANKDSGLYGEIRNSVDRDSSALNSHSTDSPDSYSRSNSGVSRKPQGLLQVHHDTAVLQQRSPTSVPSGRLSAPLVASYYIEDYPRRRVRSPESHRSRQEYEYDQSSRRSLSQPPRLRQSDQKFSPRPSFRPVNPTDKGLAHPVAAQLQIISSPQSRPRLDDNVNSRETQTARSYIQQHQQLEKNPRNSPHDGQRKLSRQEIEALYWEAQKLREGLSYLSQNMSPHAPRLGVRYHSTASLPQQAFSAYHSSIRSEQSSPMLYQPETVPRQPLRTQSVQNVGDGYGSPILRPQPVYNTVQQYQPVRHARTSHDANPRGPRARSASPGPNSNRHLSTRSLSLPRSIPGPMMLENQHYKASESVVSNFARGVPQRNTIGPIRTSSHFPHSPQIRQQSTPTIYEETQQQVGDDVRLRHAERYEHATEVDGGNGNKINRNTNNKTQNYVNRNPSTGDGNGSNKSGSGKRSKKSSSQQLVTPQPYYPPIFKRGSLVSTSTCSVDGVDSPMSPKRVSFSSYDEPLYWPTRNGPAPEPPTRQRKVQSTNPDPFLRSEEYSTYANVPEAPNRPLPPVPHDVNGATYGIISRKGRDSRSPTSGFPVSPQRWQQLSESESGSEAGEVQRILQQGSHGRGTYFRFPEEEWGADGKSRGPPGTDQSVSNVGRDEEVRRGGGGGGRSGRRDEPRRHTLSGDHHHHQQGSALARSMDLEMSSKSQRRKSPLPRGYPPPSSAMLFDDDPGIMSEVETSSTGFRRGGKQRSSLPVVRTPSKTLERPLGKTSGAGVPIGVGPMLRISPHPSAMATHHHQMVQLLNHHHGLSNKQSSATATSGGLVFLQYRNETKRALLPNEITSIDTVKALFVRSFPKQLTMEYLDSPHVKIYIHDSSKDMFYELEDLRSHLRDIRDRSVLRLFESTDMNGGVLPGAGVGVMAPPMWDQDQTYWSEPEFDSEYQHQHIHKTKASSKSGSSGGGPPQAPYYMTHSYPPGGTQGAPGASATLPRGGPLLRAYSPAVAPSVPADRIKSLPQTDRLHSESGYMSSPERGGPRAYPAAAYPPGGPGYEDPYYSQYASRSGSITPVIDEEARIRVEHMERQLANLTGLVQKALTQTPTPREYLQVPPPASARDANYRNGV